MTAQQEGGSTPAGVRDNAVMSGQGGGECNCQRYPTHQANDCPLHGLQAPFDGVPHDDCAHTAVTASERAKMTEAEAREMLLHNSDDAIVDIMRERGLLS